MIPKIKKAGAVLERAADTALLLFCMPVLWGLTYYSIRYTEDLKPNSEIPVTVVDSVFGNLVLLLIFAAVLFLIYRLGVRAAARGWLAPERMRRAVAAAAVLVAAVSIGWVALCHVEPRADGESLCYVAKLMLEGRYGTMTPPGYMSYNPHQFSLLLVIQTLFRLFGADNYQAFQYMNALCMPLLFYSGYKLLWLACGRWEACFYYLLLFLGCMPLFLYVPYVYGEITSVTFTMVLMWQVARYCKGGGKASVLWGTLAAAAACVMRMNSLIVLVAAGIVLFVYALRAAKPQAVVWLLVTVVSVFVVDGCIRSYYERESGREVLDGIPYISYVLMGLQDGPRGPGWYDGRNYNELIEHDYDTEQTAFDNKEDVKARLLEFWNDKAYGVDFFRRKILSQWNSPTYHSLYETRQFDCEAKELPGIVHQIYYEGEDAVKDYMNRYQFLLYFLTAFYAASALAHRKRERFLEDRILLIAVIGGFLFSIVWEAMSRYVLPYVVYMIPLAAVGVWRMRELLTGIKTKWDMIFSGGRF
ncbi:MAG: hypothetical protein NC399_07120 [Muribaculum sp.]|nr:hypothetical protein [Muribaculum sp.]